MRLFVIAVIAGAAFAQNPDQRRPSNGHEILRWVPQRQGPNGQLLPGDTSIRKRPAFSRKSGKGLCARFGLE